MSATDELGRFFAMDPLHQAHSPFTYAGNKPVSFTDPDGQWFGWDDAIVAGTAFTIGYAQNAYKSGKVFSWDNAEAGGKYALMATIMYNMGPVGITQANNFAVNYALNAALAPYMPKGSFDVGPNTSVNFSAGVFVAPGAGLKGGANFSVSHNIGGVVVTGGGGVGYNTRSWGGGIMHSNSRIGLSYYETTYGGKRGPIPYDQGIDAGNNSQRTAGYGISIGDFSLTLENDFVPGGNKMSIGGDGRDRWRTNAIQFSWKNWSIGSYIYTTEPSDDPDNINFDGHSDFWGPNRDKYNKDGTIKTDYGSFINGFGQVHYAPIWIGYRNGPNVMRIGVSQPFVQDFQQNGIHKWFFGGRQHYFNDYGNFSYAPYSWYGYNNPYSLFGY